MNRKQQKFLSDILNYPENKDCADIAARIVKNGGLIIFPTKGLYGIGASVNNISALQKVYEIKQRPFSKPVLMLIKDIDEVYRYCINVPEKVLVLMEKFWPGDITFVLEASENTPEILTGNTGKIGIRIPAHPFASKLLERLDFPITGTSANISGKMPSGDPDKIDKEIIAKTDLFINAGFTGQDMPSTIVEADKNGIKVLREGRITEKEIKKVLF